MQISNRDLFPTSATKTQYEEIIPLIDQPLIDGEFLRHDRAAIGAKKQYHRFGQLAIVLVALSAIFTIAEALVLPVLFQNVVLTYLAVTMAFVGIVLQCYIIFTHQKKKWLLNRYASEYIRSLKFQSFVLAHEAKDKNHLSELVNAYAVKQIARLQNQLNAGYAILTDFSPGKISEQLRPATRKTASNPELSALALEAYLELRFDYQKNFSLNNVEAFKVRRRWFTSSQDMIYLTAAIMAFISLGAKVLTNAGASIPTDWIDFSAITLFILGATEAIMDNALLEEQSQVRYEQYVRELSETHTRLDNLRKSQILPDYVLNIELVCLGELGEFCRSAERISYRF